jgi:hypothetical protein
MRYRERQGFGEGRRVGEGKRERYYMPTEQCGS